MSALCKGFHCCADGDSTIYVGGNAVEGKWIIGQYVDTPEHPCSIKDENGKFLHIVPCTNGVYTGIDDIHGKKIFVLDVIRHYNRIQDPLLYDYGKVIEKYGDKGNYVRTSAQDGGTFPIREGRRYEVVGNIWEINDAMTSQGGYEDAGGPKSIEELVKAYVKA